MICVAAIYPFKIFLPCDEIEHIYYPPLRLEKYRMIISSLWVFSTYAVENCSTDLSQPKIERVSSRINPLRGNLIPVHFVKYQAIKSGTLTHIVKILQIVIFFSFAQFKSKFYKMKFGTEFSKLMLRIIFIKLGLD